MKIKNDTSCVMKWKQDIKMSLFLHKKGIDRMSLVPYFDWELRQPYTESSDGRGHFEVPAAFKLWLKWMCFQIVWVFETKGASK